MNRDYKITSPSLNGVLSDDYLYFEGVSRPAELYVLRDSVGTAQRNGENVEILEKYFNDIHNLFLRKFSTFAVLGRIDHEETAKLQALLQELIKVKGLIQGAIENKGRNSV